ncbi:peptidyl-prolyl cis-trans isomerase [Bacillus sp. FJAT-50079]|uniref:peptidyl-prolyl cis-trans isomerase n=1 Tax=Bacillus sp. FJAT-50079 TaxID=2833577 RepID=UPI001BC8E1BF|nr:peptidyl-prolyl cis-trans isomerase [Bacillus sp. FJAT-50079]MBS4207759.1 peptidyl-prolyl cis-trans isomerase [Bacillus sp. FJAT-50079]
MNTIMAIKGKVQFPITLDAGVWIFDDRRIDLNTYFTEGVVEQEEEELTIVSKHWDRVIKEGSVAPPTLKTERQFEKVKVLTGSFGIMLDPFLKNAEPDPNASKLIIETADGDIMVPLDQAYQLILAFSKDGKPLREDGPVHIIYPDGSNREHPIKHVKAFRVE